jgi:hypothetical protein
MKRLRQICAVLLLSVAAVLVLPGVAHADVNDFTITKFDAKYTLSRDDQQGELKVVETIDVDFTDQNHGILRAIPNRYKNHRLQIDNIHVWFDDAPAPRSTYQSGGNTVLKIGDPDKTITGKHNYVIAYTLHNVVTFYDGYDEFFWDINGDQWAQRAESVTLALHLPEDLTLSEQTPVCLTGSSGSTDRHCSIHYNGPTRTISAETTRPLQPYQTMTVVAGFEKGYFTPSTTTETANEYTGTVLAFMAPLVLLGGVAGVHWFRYGRDPKGKGTIVPEYHQPDGLKPIEAGTLVDLKTDNRDITATIIDLAIRRYITIVEETEKLRFRRDRTKYTLRLEKTDFSGLAPFETPILKALFPKLAAGEQIDLDTMKYKLSAAGMKLRTDVRTRLVKGGYLRKTPLSTTLKAWGLFGLAFVVSVVIAIFNGGPAVLGIGAGVVVAIIFLFLMPSRMPKGVAAKEQFLGLKMYLETAESERLKKLQGPNAAYAHNAHEPKRTVELFEKLLPYAMVLGVEKQWANQFDHIYRTPPDWYSGHWTTFNAVYLTSALNSGIQPAVNTAFSPASNSGSSGFSGGSAGGGGGGGGGGGW